MDKEISELNENNIINNCPKTEKVITKRIFKPNTSREITPNSNNNVKDISDNRKSITKGFNSSNCNNKKVIYINNLGDSI